MMDVTNYCWYWGKIYRMLKLKPISFGYKISTTDLKLVYTESDGVNIEVEAIPKDRIDIEKYYRIIILFSTVAEVRCFTLNFYESNHNGFCISGEAFLGFYEVIDSKKLQEDINKYDPKRRFNLKHYIVAGYDSYVELIASTYSINVTNTADYKKCGLSPLSVGGASIARRKEN